ncbi:MAG: hypothetical protein ACLFQV_07115 [Vulcanimicrobiota bacterium]
MEDKLIIDGSAVKKPDLILEYTRQLIGIRKLFVPLGLFGTYLFLILGVFQLERNQTFAMAAMILGLILFALIWYGKNNRNSAFYLFASLAFFMGGIFNLAGAAVFLFVIKIEMPSQNLVWQIIVGFIMLAMGIHTLIKKNEFSELEMEKEEKGKAQKLINIIDGLKGIITDRNDVITFSSTGISKWNCKKLGGYILAVPHQVDKFNFRLLRTDRLKINLKQKEETAEMPCIVEMGEEKFKGKINTENYQKYESWKNHEKYGNQQGGNS